jgi:hypothetical protein
VLLIVASAAVVLLLGTLHLVFTFRGERFFPRDPTLMERMKEISPKISRQTTIWNAGIGFHASHSLGAILFGLVYGHLALVGESFLFSSMFLLGLGWLYLAAMTVLARKYWFTVPFRGISLALLFYTAGLATRVA